MRQVYQLGRFVWKGREGWREGKCERGTLVVVSSAGLCWLGELDCAVLTS